MSTTGALAIARERTRQIEEEGYTAGHDSGHAWELVKAAEAYAYYAEIQILMEDASPFPYAPTSFPWNIEYWKPSDDPKKNLIKAGALIASAIDALEAQE